MASARHDGAPAAPTTRGGDVARARGGSSRDRARRRESPRRRAPTRRCRGGFRRRRVATRGGGRESSRRRRGCWRRVGEIVVDVGSDDGVRGDASTHTRRDHPSRDDDDAKATRIDVDVREAPRGEAEATRIGKVASRFRARRAKVSMTSCARVRDETETDTDTEIVGFVRHVRRRFRRRFRRRRGRVVVDPSATFGGAPRRGIVLRRPKTETNSNDDPRAKRSRALQLQLRLRLRLWLRLRLRLRLWLWLRLRIRRRREGFERRPRRSC